MTVDCFVDADFAGLWPHEDKTDPSYVKSRTGYVICISGCPVIWGSRMQPDIATSTMEAEYTALSSSMKELLPFLNLVQAVANVVGLDDNIEKIIHEDNNGALTLANLEPGRVTPRSKFYAIKLHWFRSKLEPNDIIIVKVDTSLQKADILTKGLRRIQFGKIRFLLSGW
jgi:hypothetical protein